MAARSPALVNQRTGEAVADLVELAVARNTRRKGLLGRTGMGQGNALVLAPCAAVHMMFMRFAIDVLFVDADGRVLRIVPDLRPWRIAAAPSAHAAVEMAAGSLQSRSVRIGDRLHLLTDGGDRVPLHARDLRALVSASRRTLSPVVSAFPGPLGAQREGGRLTSRTPSGATDRTC